MFGPSPTPLDPSRDYGRLLPALLRNPRAELEAGFTKLRLILAAEGVQTKEMLDIYTRAATGAATSEEIARANAQMMDVLRMAGLGAFSRRSPAARCCFHWRWPRPTAWASDYFPIRHRSRRGNLSSCPRSSHCCW